jgi:hypothetical protein
MMAIFSLTLCEIKSTAGRETFSDLQLLFTFVYTCTICTFRTFHPGFREHLLFLVFNLSVFTMFKGQENQITFTDLSQRWAVLN